MKKLRITVAGKPYEVTVEILDSGVPTGAVAPVATPLAQVPVAAAAPIVVPVAPARPTGPSGPGDVACPISGKVVSIEVKLGQAVEEGVQLATVEAMKMNTYIYAPQAGTIKGILMAPGDGVEEGTIIFRIG